MKKMDKKGRTIKKMKNRRWNKQVLLFIYVVIKTGKQNVVGRKKCTDFCKI